MEKEIWIKAAVFHGQRDLRVDGMPEPGSHPRSVKTAIVFGAGPVGATTVQCLRVAGASLVVVAEVADQRKEMARNIGADVVIDPTEDDVAEAVEELTDGVGVDAVFDAAGTQETCRTAFHATARGDKVANVAIWEQEIELDPNDMVLSEAEIIGSIAYRNEYPAALALMKDDRVNTANLVTSRISLSDIVEQGFEELVANRDRHVKILVQPSGCCRWRSLPLLRVGGIADLLLLHRNLGEDFATDQGVAGVGADLIVVAPTVVDGCR